MKSDQPQKDSHHKGWTGDLAGANDEGFIYIVDRFKDTYISGGENIHPPEIEKKLFMNPNVIDVAVYGVPHEKWGELGKASILFKDGVIMTAEDLIEFLQGKIGKFEIHLYVEFIDVLLIKASWKIKRYLLSEKFGKDETEVVV